MQKLEIVTLKIEQIKEYENNVKVHTERQIEQIKKSIQEFGNCDPVSVDENYVLIEGHGRVQAMKELGYTEVQAIVLEHLTEDQKNAYRIIHNQLTMNTGFDLEMLQEELGKIHLDNLSLEEFDLHLEDDVNVDEFFKDAEKKEELDTVDTDNIKKGFRCPHCGEWITEDEINLEQEE